jgi:hypothetical protein
MMCLSESTDTYIGNRSLFWELTCTYSFSSHQMMTYIMALPGHRVWRRYGATPTTITITVSAHSGSKLDVGSREKTLLRAVQLS